MDIASTRTGRPSAADRWVAISRVVTVLALLFVFLVGVRGLGRGFDALGRDVLDAFFAATTNPFIALMVGILATTLVQSSSVSTAMIVGLVAAPEAPLPLANAVPMVMGANIGTTVTNTIVSMAHMGRRDEFERAFAVATCHDFFNFFAVAVLLPLEMATGLLRRFATASASVFGSVGGVEYESPLKAALKAIEAPVFSAVESPFSEGRFAGVAVIVASAALIFLALSLLVRTLRSAMQSRVEISLNRVLGRRVVVSVLVGAIVTVMVQSSSITTSLLVPLAGAGIVTLRQAFPITVGANIGTTVTALLASMAATGPNARSGLVIALVHLSFNLLATVVVLSIPAVRELPLRSATWLAKTAVGARGWAIVYVVLLFYGVPAFFAFLFR